MVTGDALAYGAVCAVAVERLFELRLARRNAAWAFARGGVESGQTHYRVMTLFHTLFLAACVVEPLVAQRPFNPARAAACFALLCAAQGLRWWAIATLGHRWNTRVIVIPGAEPVTGGPYRWLRHPNYLAVVVEMVALPFMHGAWITAVAASIGNALILRTRIATEERALGEPWARAFAATPRIVPGGARDGA